LTPSPIDPAPVAKDEALDRLRSVKHIVVLMMENRSFDQMLGFLEGEGLKVDGLGSAKPNFDREKREYKPFEWGSGQTMPPTPPELKPKILDPCHSPDCVGTQLEKDNTGFVKNFAATRKDENGQQVELDPEFLKVPMGHFGAQHLPVYRHLAHNFCVCDAWHSAVPGDTWPNRLFALAGEESEKVGYKRGFWSGLLARVQGLPGVKGLRDAPLYAVEAFTRQLEDRQWRWYSQDPATLRAADGSYRQIRNLNRDNFAFFEKTKLSWNEDLLNAALDTHDSFLDDAAKGQLRDVSWIDPNFADLHVLHPNSNDDHPPADIKAGQALVLEVYEALANSPNWEDTLLVIVYDEHGGFYDHVAPPAVDDGSGYPTLGVRVPALVVGPRVPKMVAHQTFDHTSLIATILRRFAADPDQAMSRMPKRVQEAPDLGALIAPAPRSDLPETTALREEIERWRSEARRVRRAVDGRAPHGEGAGNRVVLHDFQEEFLKFALAMRDAGLPPGQP